MVVPESNIANIMSFQHTQPHTNSTSPLNTTSNPTSPGIPNYTRGRPSSRKATTPTREALMESYSTMLSTKEYSTKVARKAEMDIDNNNPKVLWADQVNKTNPLGPATSNVTATCPSNTLNTTSPPMHPTHSNKYRHDVPAPCSPAVIPYNIDSPANPGLWDSDFARISIFGTKESFPQDASIISFCLKRAAVYIRQTNLAKGNLNSLPQLNLFGNAA